VGERRLFFHQFLRRPAVTGAVAPSSAALARRMVERVDFQTATVIVEYGLGTGVFTREVICRLRPDAAFLAFELNKELVAVVRRRFPEVLIYHDSAARIEHYLRLNGRDHIDAVIGGLPWASFPDHLQDEILEPTIRLLRKGGTFSTFAYLHGLGLPAGVRLRRQLKSRFSRVEISPVTWRNMPPAIVYWCTK
jgi:phosphatidylethanolamine/phosphatidyl-N-methylethanolamine N-methyltransferase